MNPMAQILRQADTLELDARSRRTASRCSIAGTRSSSTRSGRRSRSISPRFPDDYDQDEAYDRYRTAREASVDALIRLAPTIAESLLTARQMRKLPTFVGPYLDTRYLASIRSGTAGAGLGMIMMPGGGADAGGRAAAAVACRSSSSRAPRDVRYRPFTTLSCAN